MPAKQKGSLRIGGLSAVALAIGYVVIVGLYVPVGAPPRGIEPRLAYLSAHTTAWWAIIWLSIITDLLFVPFALALYRALKQLNREAMVFAAAFIGLFIVLDLAVTWTNYAALMAVATEYTNAADVFQKAAAIAAARYPAAVLDSSVLFVYNSLTLAVGIFITGAVMLRGVFSKAAAYLALVTGTLGIISVLGSFFTHALGATIVVTSVLMTVWLFIVGRRLCQLAHQATRHDTATV